MNVSDKTHILNRELLARRGIITKNGQKWYVESRSRTGNPNYAYHDVVYIYIPWPRSIFNWFGRKWCGTVNVDLKTVEVFRNHNECFEVLKKMPYFDDYEVEIKMG